MEGHRHLKFPDHTPMSNLLLAILEKAGVHQDALGDSTGALSDMIRACGVLDGRGRGLWRQTRE